MSKRKKQAELIKNVIEKVIKDVPGKCFSRKKSNSNNRKDTPSDILKEGNTKQSSKLSYIHEFLSATGSEIQEHQNVNILSIFSIFQNTSNDCWFNSVLQVIIHALNQHDENILDLLLTTENEDE